MTKLTTVATQAGRAVLLAILAAAICGAYCDKAKSSSTHAPSVTAPASEAPKQAFEMRLGFDAEGHEVSRRCVVMVSLPDLQGKYKVREEKPMECPASVAVTVGTKDDPLDIRQDAR